MTDLEISKALAIAIGWKPKQMRLPVEFRDGMHLELVANYGDYWRTFDYRDWNVIGPIAERYDCFPYKYRGEWTTQTDWVYSDTPQKAIALAVIGAKK